MSEDEKTAVDKISSEIAEKEFQRFADDMDLDLDPTAMNDEDKESLTDSRRRMVRAIQDGSMIINSSGLPEYTPRRSKRDTPITFYEPTGASLLAIDQAKRNADVSKTFKILAEITKETPALFSALMVSDVKVCTAVLGLFMG